MNTKIVQYFSLALIALSQDYLPSKRVLGGVQKVKHAGRELHHANYYKHDNGKVHLHKYGKKCFLVFCFKYGGAALAQVHGKVRHIVSVPCRGQTQDSQKLCLWHRQALLVPTLFSFPLNPSSLVRLALRAPGTFSKLSFDFSLSPPPCAL